MRTMNVILKIGLGVFPIISMLHVGDAHAQLTDFDGNVYDTIKIADQVWMAENLKVTHFPDGRAIPLETDPLTWENLGSDAPAYCYYDNDPVHAERYGILYTWAAAMNGSESSESVPSGVQGICPSGWHLPSDAEWKILTTYLGGERHAGGKMKQSGTNDWLEPNEEANNISGFSGLPAGIRFGNGSFDNLGKNGRWWSTTENTSTYAWYRYLYYDNGEVRRSFNWKNYGFSIRCVKN